MVLRSRLIYDVCTKKPSTTTCGPPSPPSQAVFQSLHLTREPPTLGTRVPVTVVICVTGGRIALENVAIGNACIVGTSAKLARCFHIIDSSCRSKRLFLVMLSHIRVRYVDSLFRRLLQESWTLTTSYSMFWRLEQFCKHFDHFGSAAWS
jgi:hypothetical protein